MTQNGTEPSRNSPEDSQPEHLVPNENLVEYVRDVHGNVTVCGGKDTISMEEGASKGGINRTPIRGILKRTKSSNTKEISGFPKVQEDDEFSSKDSSPNSNQESCCSKYNMASERKLSDGVTTVTNIPGEDVISPRTLGEVELDEAQDSANNQQAEPGSGITGGSNLGGNNEPKSESVKNVSVTEESVSNGLNGLDKVESTNHNGESAEYTPENTPTEASPCVSSEHAVEESLSNSPQEISKEQLPSSQEKPSDDTPVFKEISTDKSSKPVDKTQGTSDKAQVLSDKPPLLSERASSTDKTLSRDNSTDKTPSPPRTNSSGNTETMRKWRRTGMAVKTSLKFQEAGKLAMLKKAMMKLKKDSIKYMYVQRVMYAIILIF